MYVQENGVTVFAMVAPAGTLAVYSFWRYWGKWGIVSYKD